MLLKYDMKKIYLDKYKPTVQFSGFFTKEVKSVEIWLDDSTFIQNINSCYLSILNLILNWSITISISIYKGSHEFKKLIRSSKNSLFGQILCHQQRSISADPYNFGLFWPKWSNLQTYCQQLDKIEKIYRNVVFLSLICHTAIYYELHKPGVVKRSFTFICGIQF